MHCLSAVSPPPSPTSCASRSRGTSVVFRRPLHGHVHVSAQHDRWIKLRRCRSVTVAQSVWVCLVAFSSQYSCFLFVYFCQPTSVDSCTLHALCQTPKSGSRRELCSHPVHPSYTLSNTIRASYGSCFVEYCSTVLFVHCRPTSVNIDITVHSRPEVEKEVLI